VTPENYQAIFELGWRSFPWARVIQPLVFLVGGLLLIKLFKRKTTYLIVLVFVTSMASLIFLISLVVFIPDFVKLRAAYVSGKSVVVEGVVQNFRPAPTIGPAIESFSVNGVSFSYNALDDTPCFHNAPLHGGPVREGLNVRIHCYEGCIQRIEVSRKASIPSSKSQP
jgi:hypothetical protein